MFRTWTDTRCSTRAMNNMATERKDGYLRITDDNGLLVAVLRERRTFDGQIEYEEDEK